MDGSKGGSDGRRQALQWETVTAVATQWMGGGGSRIMMGGIEIAVDGSGGDGQQWRNGWQDGRAAAAGQGDGVSPSS